MKMYVDGQMSEQTKAWMSNVP